MSGTTRVLRFENEVAMKLASWKALGDVKKGMMLVCHTDLS